MYIDDVILSVPSHDDNLQKLSEVFQWFRKHNLKIKPSKCFIGTARITYLGYDICKDKSYKKLAWTQMHQGLMSLMSFFRRAIEDYGAIWESKESRKRKRSSASGPSSAKKSKPAPKEDAKDLENQLKKARMEGMREGLEKREASLSSS